MPANWDIWDALDNTSEIEAEGFVVKQGINFALFNAPQDVVFLTGEFPQYFKRPWVYHVERARHDQILISYARRNGVDVREGWIVKDKEEIEKSDSLNLRE